MNAFLFAILLVTAQSDPSAPGLFDLGSGASAVWEGCTRVTPDSVFTPQAGFGWQSKEGLKALVRAYTGMVENRSRGRDEPPPIWTNPITEDAILSDRENAFLFQTPPGEYELYVLCGTSEALSAQYFDFTVQVGDDQQHVQIEGGHQFRALRFHARAGGEPLAVKFTPRSTVGGLRHSGLDGRGRRPRCRRRSSRRWRSGRFACRPTNGPSGRKIRSRTPARCRR